MEYLSRVLAAHDDILVEKSQSLDFFLKDLDIYFNEILFKNKNKVNEITKLLLPPEILIRELDAKTKMLENRINTKVEKYITKKDFVLKSISSLLNANSFERTLKRGFTIVMDEK